MTFDSLIFSNTPVTAEGCEKMFRVMKNPQQLRHVDASFTGIKENSLKTLMDRCNGKGDLSLLELDGVTISKDIADMLLKAFKNLNKITCSNGKYTVFRDSIVVRLPPGDLSQCKVLDLSNSEITSDVLNNILLIAANPQLVEINLSNSKVDDSLIPIIQKYKK